jgi:hypothetical protein
MKWGILLVPLVVALAAAACSDEESAPNSEIGGTVAQLRETVIRYGDAFIGGRYEDAYHLHTSEWQSRCPVRDWMEMMKVKKQDLTDQVVTKGGDMSTAKFVVTAVEVDGSRSVHQGHIEVSGEAYRFGDQDLPAGGYWIWRDGRWQATDDRTKPC